jgi:deoxyribodipyrimidine photo-lyase
MIFASDRGAALDQLDKFLPAVKRYGWDRNGVTPGHAAVSQLSPAIRHRLLSEYEVAASVLEKNSYPQAEKFVQEIYWRRYWKSWLSLRPEVWQDYREALQKQLDAGGESILARAAAGQLGNAVMDYFAKELVETGYLHNHARMWFAGWWIHQARLPWELGAAFFFRYLLDGDPASNTLSWRWVAGLQTPGKTYLTRRSNLEKYLAPSLLKSLAAGLGDFENPQAFLPKKVDRVAITQPLLEQAVWDRSLPTGLWIHEEDLSVERSLLGAESFTTILVTANTASWQQWEFPEQKCQWLTAALEDAAARAAHHWKLPAPLVIEDDLVLQLSMWAQRHQLSQIVTLRPDIGPLSDALERLRKSLTASGIQLLQVDRAEDLELRPLAQGGFFQFWEKLSKRLPSTD